MNDSDLQNAFRNLGLSYLVTTLVSPKKILLRVRNLIEGEIKKIERHNPSYAGKTSFNSLREIIPLFAPKATGIVPSGRPSLGKLLLHAGTTAHGLVVDVPPTAEEYREVIIQRPKRQRLVVKRSELDKTKVENADGLARVSIIPEPLILSKVFNEEDDDDDSDDSEKPAKPVKQRKKASIFVTDKEREQWDMCKKIYPLSDSNLYSIQGNKSKKRIFLTTAPSAANTDILLSSKYKKYWTAYFQIVLAIFVATTWGIDYYSASPKALARRLKYERWFESEVTPKIRAKLQKYNHNKPTSVVNWALTYDSIEFRDSEKTKWFVRMQRSNNEKYKSTTVKLSKATCLELDILWLALHPLEYFHRRVYQYLYQTCVTNAISDLQAYLRVMNSMAAAKLEEDMVKELRIWWALLAACGADYITEELLHENKDLSISKLAPELPLANISFH
jgi:hypothetical protein